MCTTAKAIRNFWSDLNLLYSEGSPFLRALNTVGNGCGNKIFFETVRDIRHQIQRDISFDQALAKHPNFFGANEIKLMAVGRDNDAEFCHNLKILAYGVIKIKADEYRDLYLSLWRSLSLGHSLIRALTIASKRCTGDLRAAIISVRAGVKENPNMIFFAMGKTKLFNDYDLHLIDLGQESGRLQEMFLRLANES